MHCQTPGGGRRDTSDLSVCPRQNAESQRTVRIHGAFHWSPTLVPLAEYSRAFSYGFALKNAVVWFLQMMVFRQIRDVLTFSNDG